MVINESSLSFYDHRRKKEKNIYILYVCTTDTLFYASVFICEALAAVRSEQKKYMKEWSHKLIDPFIFIIKTRVSSTEKYLYIYFINFLWFIFVEVLWFFRFSPCIYLYFIEHDALFLSCCFMWNGIEAYWWRLRNFVVFVVAFCHATNAIKSK